jgi:ATP-dependent exoDNAse (exonuclease V) beta subunit
MPEAGEDEEDEAKLFYVAAPRATHRLVVGVSGEGAFGKALAS